MAGSVSNEKVEPMYATFGEAVMQSENITLVADVAGSLNNKYFNFYTTGGVHHYAWFNINSAGTDPAVSGATAHEITGATGATAAALATATAAVLGAVSGFDSTSDGAVLNLVATTAGYAKPAHEGAAPTGFSFEVLYYGDSAIDLGYVDGDIAITNETNYVELTAHQTGTEILGHIGTGGNQSITLSLKETSVNQLRKMILGEGDSMIPDGTGVSSTEVFGWGSSRQFKQTQARARKLVLHPVVLPASNMSRDVTIWKAFPKVSDLTFSGENVLMIPVEFFIYRDSSKDPRIDKVCIGDASQTLS